MLFARMFFVLVLSNKREVKRVKEEKKKKTRERESEKHHQKDKNLAVCRSV
jgi:hypothetical protein